MRIIRTLSLLLSLSILAGCAAFRFGPGLSMTDPQYFSEPPYIVAKPDGYSLRWRYGTWPFYFYPESRVRDGQLVFALRGSSSTGSASGKYGEVAITGSGRIHALESAGAFWLEPDGRKIQLEVRKNDV
jgi:hypothetical protein